MRKITREFADYINHKYGCIRVDGVIKNYVFQEGDSWDDFVEFMNAYYPNEIEKYI